MTSRFLSPESIAARIVEEEERLLASVQGRAAAASVDQSQPLGYDEELISLRDQLAEAKPEDLASLVEQMMRVSAIAERRGRSRTLPIDVMSPYFAHLRLKEGGKERDVLIGKRGFIDRQSGVQVVDWRNAPVSQIYYRYEEGDDYDEHFQGGHLEGLVFARRNLSIAQAKLRRIGCPQGTFIKDARGAWLEAEGQPTPILQGGQGQASRPPRPVPKAPKGRLGVHSGKVPRADKHLPEIAALIDREQFDLITRPESGLVIIQGGAGSGKTTVALHRVAFLNFHDPRRFKPSKMLVVVPSPSLARYVEGVLPSLGVTGVPVVTFRGWISSMRRRLIPRAVGTYAEDTPDAVVRVKKHPVLLRVLEEHAATQAARLERDLPEPVAARFHDLSAVPLVPRCRRVQRWLEKEGGMLPPALRHQSGASLLRASRRAKNVVRGLAELLTDEALLTEAFARHAPSEVTREDIAATVRWTSRLREESTEGEHAGMIPEHLEAIDGRPIDEDAGEPAGGRLDKEDDALLVRIHQIMHGGLVDPRATDPARREIRYEHVAIDEAQDLSPVEIKVLLEATTPQRSVTIAGDAAQRLVFDNGFRDFPSLLREVGHPTSSIAPLRLSYRSTSQVMEFSRAILGPLADLDQPLTARPGAPVELYRFSDMGEAVALLAESLRSLSAREPTASVAVIARHPEQADATYAALARAEVPALRRVRRHDFLFAPGVDVTDVTQVKGLEFDYVILVEVTAMSYPDSIEARHLLHIGATRAAHQLWVIATSEPSPLVQDPWLSGA
ncbi:MAG: ATP-binding domain-containing protein [Deltaproteobacteria bacterium]|nr:ATP-binding domain-containing protein [Deltaproteobacteria bacterium]